jgi:hypothetical protein
VRLMANFMRMWRLGPLLTVTGLVLFSGASSRTAQSSSSDSPNVVPATAIASGWSHTCALTATGAVECWGDNSLGQLGTGSDTGPETCLGSYACSTNPTSAVGLGDGVTQISAGGNNTCAVTADQAVKCWGANMVYGTPPYPWTDVWRRRRLAWQRFWLCPNDGGWRQVLGL